MESSLINCCKTCPNKTISSRFCYNGKECSECPTFNELDTPDAKPPKDIKNMLQKE